MSTTNQFCTFYLGDLFLGIEVCRVQEVLRHPDMTDVPLTSAVVAGLVNLRGQIVTAMDLRRRFGLPSQERADEEPPMSVVVRADGDVVSLLVDEIGDVLEVSEDTWEPPLTTMTGSARELVSGVHKLDGQLLLILDVEQILDFDATRAAAGLGP